MKMKRSCRQAGTKDYENPLYHERRGVACPERRRVRGYFHMKTVKVRVPATIGNLGPGFDVLGMALTMFSEYEISAGGFKKKNRTEYEFKEREAKTYGGKNIISVAMKKVFDEYGKHPSKCVIKSNNRIPLSRGLGSSAAARVAGIMAANGLCGGKLNINWMLNAVSALEGHPDNAAPAFYGGIVFSAMYESAVYHNRIGDGKRLKVVVNISEGEVLTEKARKVFREMVPRSDACDNLRNLSASCTAWNTGKYGILEKSTVDYLHQPYREKLVPGMKEVFSAALKGGAYGAVLSGSGPTIAAFCPDDDSLCRRVGQAMEKARAAGGRGIRSATKILRVAQKGAEYI